MRLLAVALALRAGGRGLREGRAARSATSAEERARWAAGRTLPIVGFRLPRSLLELDPSGLAAGAGGAETKPPLWLYWDSSRRGDPAELPEGALRVSMRTVQQACGEDFGVRLVGDADLPALLPKHPLPAYFAGLPTNIKGDLARTALLAEHGGVYLDSDVLVLKTLRPLYDEVLRPGGPELVSWVDPGSQFASSFMAVPPQSALFGAMYPRFLSFLEERGECAGQACARPDKLGWSDMVYGVGNKVLSEYMAAHGAEKFEIAGPAHNFTATPYARGATELFADRAAAAAGGFEETPGDAYMVHWMHAWVSGPLHDYVAGPGGWVPPAPQERLAVDPAQAESSLLSQDTEFARLAHLVLG